MKIPKNLNFKELVIKNSTKRPFRNIATIFAFAIIAGTLLTSMYLTSGATESLDIGMSRMGADLLVVPVGYAAAGQSVILTGAPSTFFFKDAGFEKIAHVPGVAKASPQIYVATLFGQKCCSAPVEIIAIDPKNDFTISTWMKENPGKAMGKDDIIVGDTIIGDVGTDLLFYGHTFHIAGRLERTGTGVDCSVFTRMEDAYTMADESGTKAVKQLVIPKGMVSVVLVKVNSGASPDAVAKTITEQVPGTRVITPSGLMGAVNGQIGAVTQLLFYSTLATTVVFIPLLGTMSAMVAHERRREISIIRALGASRGFVMRLMLAESFSLAIAGSLAGIGIAMVILVGFQDLIAFTLKIPFIAPSPGALLTAIGSALLLSIGIGGLASIYPAVMISRTKPYETIRKGEP